MSASYVDEVRKAPKTNKVVVKLTTILQEISRHNANNVDYIFLVEGKDDVMVYERWIDKIDYKMSRKIIDVGNKDLVLDVFSKIKERKKNSDIHKNIFACVDNDFDGLKNHVALKDDTAIFITDSYSVENHIASDETLKRILSCEFRCRDQKKESEVLKVFNEDFSAFLSLTKHLNYTIYACRIKNINISIKPSESFNKNFLINIREIIVNNPENIVDFDAEKSAEIDLQSNQKIYSDFNNFDGKLSYRGKFNYFFFIKWIRSLAQNDGIPAKDGKQRIKICNFEESEIKESMLQSSGTIGNTRYVANQHSEISDIKKSSKVKINSEQWSVSFYASHSSPPEKFEKFIKGFTA